MEIDTITLVSYEGKEYTISSAILNYSSILNSVPNPSEKVFLSYLEIDSESIEKVIEYYSHYEFLPPTVLQENSSDLLLLKILPPWDLAFVNDLSDEVLNKLIHCCVRLEITPLLDLLCLSIAARFRDCKETAKQLRLNFDAYEAVESQIYLKNKYAWASN